MEKLLVEGKADNRIKWRISSHEVGFPLV